MTIKNSNELIFIHGAWASGWGWSSLMPYFDQDEFHCHCVNLPGSESKAASVASNHSLEDYVHYLTKLVVQIDKPVWLIAHSGGGLSATAVAQVMPDKILGIIYVAGMLLPPGMSFGQLCQILADQSYDVSGISPYLHQTPYGTEVVSVEGVKDIFLQDANDESISQIFEKLVAQPNRARVVSVDWTQDAAGQVKKYYIEALNDKSLILPLQKEMQKLTQVMGTASIDCGHFPQVVAPEKLSELIKGFID